MISDLVIEQAAIEERARLERIARAWDYYYGRMPRPLKVRRGEPDDNLTLNFARPIVDKGVAFLFGQDISFSLNASDDSEAADYLAACWGQNRMMSLLSRIATNGGVTGHAFVKVSLPTAPFSPPDGARAPALRRAGGLPRLVALDTAAVRVRWEPDDYEAATEFVLQWHGIDPRTGRPVARRQVIARDGARWRVTDQASPEDSPRWETIGRTVWPYAWPPILYCQNLPAPNAFWGVSDLEDDVLRVNDGMNFVLSNLARIVRYHAHPKTWGKGFAAQQLRTAPDETIVLPSPEATLQNLEMQSDLGSSLALYQRLKEALHECARIPEVATGKLESVGALSGVALQILYQPLLEKTQTKRRLYGELLVELSRRLLEMGGHGGDHEVTIRWPALLPADPLRERQALTLEQQLGVVSRATLAEKLGYGYAAERRRMARESAPDGEVPDAGCG